jgi:hypothetical protein
LKRPQKALSLAKSFALIFWISGLTCAAPKNGKLPDMALVEKRLDTVNIRMRESMVEAIDALAREEGIDRSKWVCRLIESAL